MKITKSYLKQVIKEELNRIDEAFENDEQTIKNVLSLYPKYKDNILLGFFIKNKQDNQDRGTKQEVKKRQDVENLLNRELQQNEILLFKFPQAALGGNLEYFEYGYESDNTARAAIDLSKDVTKNYIRNNIALAFPHNNANSNADSGNISEGSINMKITKSYLKQVIKEELGRINEIDDKYHRTFGHQPTVTKYYNGQPYEVTRKYANRNTGNTGSEEYTGPRVYMYFRTQDDVKNGIATIRSIRTQDMTEEQINTRARLEKENIDRQYPGAVHAKELYYNSKVRKWPELFN